MNRQEVFDWCRQRYGTEPDYPWNDWNAVLRHTDNNKWYGVIIEVDRSKLGMDGTGVVDVLNVKCDPTIIGMLLTVYCFNVLHQFAECSLVCLKQVIAEGCAYL